MLTIEEEIDLINEITGNAVIHGADSGGTYNQNGWGIYKALHSWIRAMCPEGEYHIIYGSYSFKPDGKSKYTDALEGIWGIPKIVPVTESPDELFADYMDRYKNSDEIEGEAKAADIEEQIRLVNEITANAVIHGGDSEGSYDQNTRGIFGALMKWIKAKCPDGQYHIIHKGYRFEPHPDDRMGRYKRGVWGYPAIVPVTEEPDERYSDFYDECDDLK